MFQKKKSSYCAAIQGEKNIRTTNRGFPVSANTSYSRPIYRTVSGEENHEIHMMSVL
jgi:hypothetical protein